MWVLECSGDNLKGKKLWLSPGEKYLFGRTKTDDNCKAVVVSHKTISRKHLKVEVGYPDTDDCSNPRSKSKVIVEDFNTKIGTLLNGSQIRGLCVELDKDKNTIFLGRYEQSYHIIWVPVTLTFSFTLKEHKANPYIRLYKIFGPLDIKILSNYEPEFTTHVVAKKRNTAKSLQALIDGKYIVHNDSFINALIAVTSPNSQGIIPLQDDFNGNFPNPCHYLPSKGDEPTQYDEKAYAPNKLRQNIFNGYSFVLYEERQYENLSPPITAGGGKAILYPAKPYETTVNEFVNYINEISCERKALESTVERVEKNLVIVRFNPIKGPDMEWYADFGIKVAFHLDYRLAEQNEFLDAILGNDASILRRPLTVETHATYSERVAAGKLDSNGSLYSESLLSSQVEESKPLPLPSRYRSRRAGRSKFTGFDDDFTGPPESFVNSRLYTSPQNNDSCINQHSLSKLDPVLSTEDSQSLGLSISPDLSRVLQEPRPQASPKTSSKRKAHIIFQEELKSLAEPVPIELAQKRRRLNIEDNQSLSDDKLQLSMSLGTGEKNLAIQKDMIISIPPKSIKDKNIEDIDAEVEKLFRQKFEREEINANSNVTERHKPLEEELSGLDIGEVRKKIQIGVIEVKQLNGADHSRKVRSSDRWDERWNGRRNFKKFKRRGENRGHRGLDKVIVPLKEAEKKSYGIEEDFWVDNSSKIMNKDQRKNVERRWTSQAENPNLDGSRKNLSGPNNRSYSPIFDLSDSEKNTQHRQRPESSDKDTLLSSTAKFSLNRSLEQTQSSRSTHGSPETGLKRAAHAILINPGPVKKPKLLGIKQTIVDNEEESDDELKFRFRKKR